MRNRLTYYIKVFGCQMNKSDSQRVRSVMDAAGFELVDEKNKADILIVVACSVRQSAVDRIWGLVKPTKQLTNKSINQLLVITGCLLPEEKKKFSKRVDLVVDIKDIQKLSSLIDEKNNKIARYQDHKPSIVTTMEQWNNGTMRRKPADENDDYGYLKINPRYSSFFSAYVPIMTGCDNYCAYCVVPYTRGREYSRPVEEILEEVNKLVVRRVKEIILLGQNVNSYKSSFNNEAMEQWNNDFIASLLHCSIVDFPLLLRIINSIDGNFWIRFVTSHPKDLSDDLIEAMVEREKVTEYLHLPAQSGDNEILENMNRIYTIEHYKELIDKIRLAYAKKNIVPGISTDIIVGFPEETKEQFENTVGLFEDVRYDMAYVAQYSPRPGTTAAKLNDNVPKEEKKRREKVLTGILKKTALENNQKLIGQDIDVLVENCKNNICMGKTRTFKNVKFDGTRDLVGKFVKVKIKQADVWGLKGVRQ